MYTIIRIKLNERVVVFHNGLPLRALGPGRHFLWGSRKTEQRWTTDTLVFQGLPEVRALLPRTWFQEVTLAPRERGILYRDGKPCGFLRPGTHRYWTVDPSVRSEEHTSELQSPDTNSYAVFCLRSEERRVGKECLTQCRSRWSPYH